jgi:hypothetical protein
VIKLQGWEEIFLKGVEDARRIEYMWLLKYVYSTAINILSLWLTPLVTCVAIFSACIYFNDMTLAPGMAFTTVATVRTMEEPMRIFPQALIAVSQVHRHLLNNNNDIILNSHSLLHHHHSLTSSCMIPKFL